MEFKAKIIPIRERESAFKRAKRAISRRLYELKFATYPKTLRDELTERGLDPGSVDHNSRMEIR